MVVFLEFMLCFRILLFLGVFYLLRLQSYANGAVLEEEVNYQNNSLPAKAFFTMGDGDGVLMALQYCAYKLTAIFSFDTSMVMGKNFS
jgi:hypothetical protein